MFIINQKEKYANVQICIEYIFKSSLQLFKKKSCVSTYCKGTCYGSYKGKIICYFRIIDKWIISIIPKTNWIMGDTFTCSLIISVPE